MVLDDFGLRFTWHGGEYIEVASSDALDQPFDVINVWDYAASEPTIARTLDAFEARCGEWQAAAGHAE